MNFIGLINVYYLGKKPKMNNNNYLKSMQYIKPGTSSGAGCGQFIDKSMSV